jgi:hypothetical protein
MKGNDGHSGAAKKKNYENDHLSATKKRKEMADDRFVLFFFNSGS